MNQSGLLSKDKEESGRTKLRELKEKVVDMYKRANICKLNYINQEMESTVFDYDDFNDKFIDILLERNHNQEDMQVEFMDYKDSEFIYLLIYFGTTLKTEQKQYLLIKIQDDNDSFYGCKKLGFTSQNQLKLAQKTEVSQHCFNAQRKFDSL